MKAPTDLITMSYGHKENGGNLVGIEPYVTPADYASPSKLEQKLKSYLSCAQEKGWINQRTVVVWPEYIGTWLLFSGEKKQPSIQMVIEKLIKAHLEEYLGFYNTAKEQNKVFASLFRTKAPVIVDEY